MKEQIKDYFEGVLQLRHSSKEVVDWVHKRIKEDDKARIAKEKKTVNGIDIYLSDQHYLQNLGRKIRQRFFGILKVSKRLHTVHKMTSRHLYRVTVLFRELPWKRGDVIRVHGDEMRILGLNGRMKLQDIKTCQKKDIDVQHFLKIGK